MATLELLAQLVRKLGDACGFDLTLVEESIIDNHDGSVVAWAKSPRRSEIRRAVSLAAQAEILISPMTPVARGQTGDRPVATRDGTS